MAKGTRRTQGEGSVYMRKDGRAAASAMYEGKRITKYGKTKTEAKQKLDAYLDDLKKGRVLIGPKQTVEQYLTYWLENVHRLEIEATSLDRYRTALRVHLIPAFGKLQLSSLTREKIQVFLTGLFDAGYAPATVDFMHAVLSAAFKHAVIHGLLSQNPCEYVVLPKKQKHKPHVLSLDECTRLIEAARGRRLWFMFLVALTTGARVGELCALRWEDIDVNTLRIHIHRNRAEVMGVGVIEKQPKSVSGSRKVILAQPVLDGIASQKAYIAELRLRVGPRWQDLGLVFPNRTGGFLNPRQVNRELRATLADAGIDPRRFHELRHSAATILFAAGVNPKVVSEALGHSNISTTLWLYGDVTPDMQQGVANVMNELFGG